MVWTVYWAEKERGLLPSDFFTLSTHGRDGESVCMSVSSRQALSFSLSLSLSTFRAAVAVTNFCAMRK